MKDIARAAPKLPGVYLFKDAAGRVLYVGKARSLRDRLANYFSPNVAGKTKFFLTKARKLETLLCRSEYEAFMLEYTLIKEHRPAFNIVFRDDKRYPYIKITGGDFPRVILTRRVDYDDDGGAKYFGPYVSGLNVRRLLDMIHRFFKIRTCKRELLEGVKNPPLCLQYHIKRCDGPCELLVSKAEYGAQVMQAERFLRGDYETLITDLKSRMKTAAEEKNYELAAICRDRVLAIHELSEKQRAASANARDLDAIAFVSDPNRGRICFYLFKVRKGHITGNAGFVFPIAAASEPEALSNFLMEYYKLAADIPGDIAVIAEPEDSGSLRRRLSERSGRAVRVWSPQKGYARDLIVLAEKNARAKLYEKADPEAEEVLDRLREKLQLARRPECIHGYDVANLGPSIVTGARVVFKRGTPAKTLYRSYGLQVFDVKDDYAAMEELVRRSVRRTVEQEPDAMPDLLLIDGGLGHVRAARKALAAMQHSARRPGFEIIGLAKEEELIVMEDGKIIRLKPGDPALNLLQRVRNEAHRFSRRLMASRAKKRMLKKGLR